MDEKVIQLNVKAQDFEEIYFSGKQGSLFFSPTTKVKTISTAIVLTIFIITILCKDLLSKEMQGIIYFISFLLVLCAVYLSFALNKFSRWKKSVLQYLKTLENASIYEIRFNKEYFNVNIDGKEELSKWSDFVLYEVFPTYISLEGKYNYMFPKKSMSEKDFTYLKQTLKNYIKE